MAADAAADVKASYAAWDEAFNKADADAVAATYTEDAVLLAPGGPPKHGEEIGAFFAGLFENGVGEHAITLDEVVDSGGAVVVGVSRWTATAPEQGGGRSEIGGNVVHVFERQDDGSLKLRGHIFN